MHLRRVDAIPRTLSGLLLGDIALGSRRRQGCQSFACVTVTDNDHRPSLAITATRCKASILQDPEECLVWQRVVCEFPRRKGRAHDVVQFHAPSSLDKRQLMQGSPESMATWRRVVNGNGSLVTLATSLQA